jgi:hypothetical protein
MMCGYCGFLMQPRTRARYAMPPAFPGIGLLFARTPFIALTELARRLIPGQAVENWLDRTGSRRREEWLAQKLAGRKAQFEAKF